MKISFVGSHGTGKTTLCHGLMHRLKQNGYSVGLVEEVSREAYRAGLPINEDTSTLAQEWILHRQIQRELEEGYRNDHVVTDRSLVDNYAYLLRKEIGTGIVRNGLLIGFHPHLEAMIHRHLISPGYDAMFYVPIIGQLEDDKIRSLDPEFQKQVDELVLELMGARGFAVPYTKIPEDLSGNDRLEFVLEHIDLRV